MPDPLLELSRTLRPEMSGEEVAVHALSGIEFASLEASLDALRSVAAAVHVMTKGPVRTKPVLVTS